MLRKEMRYALLILENKTYFFLTTNLVYGKALLGWREESRALGILDHSHNGSWIQF